LTAKELTFLGATKRRQVDEKKGSGEWRVADKALKIPHPRGLYGCETKRVAGKRICNSMKTKGEEKWLAQE
jgi:hypothetical protein